MRVRRIHGTYPAWMAVAVCLVLCLGRVLPCHAGDENELKVGAASVEVKAEDSMVIGGGIHPGRASGQEGKLRASAVVVRAGTTVCLVSCDVLGMTRDDLDEVCRKIENRVGIPSGNILVASTHTHHAPSTKTIHAYKRDEEFCRRVNEAIVSAAQRAHERMMSSGLCNLHFWLGEESSVGQNSRLLLADGTIYWVGNREDAVRPTGPFDPELPVMAFKQADGRLEALLFNHSTHTIGTLEPGKRSPSFYGLAAQAIEQERGGTAIFLPGAFGSTHNLSLPCRECLLRIKRSVEESLSLAEPRAVDHVVSIKREFTFQLHRNWALPCRFA